MAFNIPQIKTTNPPVENGQIDSKDEMFLLSKFRNKAVKQSFTEAEGKPKKKSILKSKGFKILILSLMALLVVILGVLSYSSLLVYRVYQNALATKASVEVLVAAGKEQNLSKVKGELGNTKDLLTKLRGSYNSLLWIKPAPFIGDYVADGDHALKAAEHGIEASEILLTTIEPYADILGLGGDSFDESADGAETAQDRLDFVVKSIPEIIPQAGELSEKMSLAQEELSQIDPERYPKEFKGIIIRQRLKKGLDLVDMGSQLISSGKPLLEVAPYLMGTKGERRYLILFQNDKELRPTGGFITAYSIAIVESGKFRPVSSNDIYNLDANYTPSIPAPKPIVNYIKGPYKQNRNLRLRDINWSPDFSKSMELFTEEIKRVGIRKIDGIIAVDTQLLVNILDVLGPIGVPGFGNFSSENDPRCECPQVVYELESFADVEGSVVWDQLDPTKIIFAPPNYKNRKKIIGPLMNSVLANALGQSKEKIPALFEAGFKSLMEKHVIFYLLDKEAQKAVEAFGVAGTIKDYQGDYLHINDANLGGRKSNLYVTREVVQEIEVKADGQIENTLTITYNNPEKHDGWLNSVLPNWVRIYVPKGSELVSFEGVQDEEAPYEDLGKTVFAGFFKLRPQGVSQVVVKYKLPFKAEGEEYKLLIQKQPGLDVPLYTVSLGDKQEELLLRTDREFKFPL